MNSARLTRKILFGTFFAIMVLIISVKSCFKDKAHLKNTASEIKKLQYSKIDSIVIKSDFIKISPEKITLNDSLRILKIKNAYLKSVIGGSRVVGREFKLIFYLGNREQIISQVYVNDLTAVIFIDNNEGNAANPNNVLTNKSLKRVLEEMIK